MKYDDLFKEYSIADLHALHAIAETHLKKKDFCGAYNQEYWNRMFHMTSNSIMFRIYKDITPAKLGITTTTLTKEKAPTN